jgi:flavorubredoxin
LQINHGYIQVKPEKLMGSIMEPIELSKGVYNVGVTDWNIRDFHGYSTDLGSTYNAFLIVDEKIALIDTVREGFADQLLENISRIVDLKKIDYVISNHTEMDHSGGLHILLQNGE